MSRIFNNKFEDLIHSEKKYKVLLEQNGRCDLCGLYEWAGKKIKLEYHHKDGNRKNESRENVQFLCPNCHSLTWDFRFSGKKHTREWIEKMISINTKK